MDDLFWAKVHGASVHAPLALTAASAGLDLAGLLASGRPSSRSLHAAGHWAILLAAAGTVPAAASGIIISRGVLLGHDLLRLHHLFVWPALALVVAAAVWRLTGAGPESGRPSRGYLGLVAVATTLIGIAGYWGGELMLRGLP